MKRLFNAIYLIILFSILGFSACVDESQNLQSTAFFEVKPTDYQKNVADTLFVNVNEKIAFSFTNGNTDQILFYSGESGREYRFANRAFFSTQDATVLESKVSIATTVANHSSTIASSFSLKLISGMKTGVESEFLSATKADLMNLRATSTTGAQLAESYAFTSNSTPFDLTTGDVNIAVVAKSADATKNHLSITASGITITNSEIRDYGYSFNGVTVTNQKTVNYPIVSNVLTTAGLAWYSPNKTIAPTATTEVENAVGYAWNLGETGVNYLPAVNGGVVSANSNGIVPVLAYPVSIVAPTVESKIVLPNAAPYESWLITRAFNPLSVKPDAAIVVKRMEQSTLANYQYIYRERGIYKASIVGVNVGMNSADKKVFEFVVVVKNATDNL